MKKNPHCQGCKYYRPLHHDSKMYICHYLLDTGNPKNCRVENCDKRDARKPRRKEAEP